MGCSVMNIGIVEENTKLRRWYEENGAKHIGTVKYDFSRLPVERCRKGWCRTGARYKVPWKFSLTPKMSFAIISTKHIFFGGILPCLTGNLPYDLKSFSRKKNIL